MSNRNLVILGIISVIMVVLAVVASHLSKTAVTPQLTGAGYLIQGLDPDKIASIAIEGGGKRIMLNKLGKNFVVANKDNYPAKIDEINKLVSICLDIRTARFLTDNPANFKDLGVIEEDAHVVVKFFKADSSLLTGVIIGNPKPRTRGIAYVRRAGDNKVYETATQIPWINKRAIEYTDRQLVNIRREDINSITVSGPATDENAPVVAKASAKEFYVLRFADGGGTIKLENMPEDKKLKEGALGEIFEAIEGLKIDDVNSADSENWPALSRFIGIKFDHRFDCRLNDSTVYAFRLAKDGDKWFARCTALFMDQSEITMTKGVTESQEALKKKEAKLLARDAAEEFAKKHKGWVYQIPAYQGKGMTKPLAELLEDEPNQASEPNEVTADTNLPNEASD
ncbi:MAG: DUF4340 domain-containing protein [Sedimentisphaerales bacterium]|nr:DUF4340 domain-containing protein [Sedimentisphaerales bacterium]